MDSPSQRLHKPMGMYVYGGFNTSHGFCFFNPLPSNDAHMRHGISISHKNLYGEFKTVHAILQYMLSASFSCFLWLVKGQYYTPYSARMSPENTKKLKGFNMEALILQALYFSTWFLLL